MARPFTIHSRFKQCKGVSQKKFTKHNSLNKIIAQFHLYIQLKYNFSVVSCIFTDLWHSRSVQNICVEAALFFTFSTGLNFIFYDCLQLNITSIVNKISKT